MPFFIALTVGFFVFVAVYIVVHSRNAKYLDFVTLHSTALRDLYILNGRYQFYTLVSQNQSKTYDNQKFYDSISCQDYLIYHLQFPKSRDAINKEIQKAIINKHKYEAYCKEVSKIESFGSFSEPVGKLKMEQLIALEKAEFEKTKCHPAMTFSVTVVLRYSNMSGQVFRTKSQAFTSEEIQSLIKRLDNRTGLFYNDREIWNSICRVERGKVSNRMRFSIFERDGYRCRYCGRSGTSETLEIDHIRPIAKGGKSTYDNLQTLCRQCNLNKGARY